MPYKDKSKRDEYYAKNKVKILEQRRARHRANPHKNRITKWREQGINVTHEEYESMLVQQAYCCAICGTHASELKQALHVDHDHKTGRIRGLLCRHCNSGIGLLKDEPLIVESALKYLAERQ